MAYKSLQVLEDMFFERYPKGFADPDLAKIVKKHNIEKLAAQVQENFEAEKFHQPQQIMQSMIKLVSRSSMISMFDKPKFRDAINSLTDQSRERISEDLYQLLYGEAEAAFESLVFTFAEMKLARWSLLSVLPFYHAPQDQWFIKPTTTKAILKYFEKDKLIYKPRPRYSFYSNYSAFLNELKSSADPQLSKNNAAFTGFLMMTLQGF